MYRMRNWIWLAVVLAFLTGCQAQTDSSKKVRDLEFSIVEEGALPTKLAKTIQEKQGEPLKLTYQDQEQLYICVGYGTQPTGGYSIVVEELYLAENAIYFDTTLMGPAKGEELVETPSYPCIVVVTEGMELPVVFQ